MSRCSKTGAPTLFALGAWVICACSTMLPVAQATTPAAPASRSGATHDSVSGRGAMTALGGFVKDRALANLLGETLYRDTVEVMSDSAAVAAITPPTELTRGQFHDNSAAGQVARAVLAHHSLDKYLWLIRRAYDDTLWKGGSRARIEEHFALIWRTSIMLYESTLSASPHRVHVCAPTEGIDEFDCHDEIGRARIVPIPAEMPLLGLQHHQANMG